VALVRGELGFDAVRLRLGGAPEPDNVKAALRLQQGPDLAHFSGYVHLTHSPLLNCIRETLRVDAHRGPMGVPKGGM
jgi:hypothetical protein